MPSGNSGMTLESRPTWSCQHPQRRQPNPAPSSRHLRLRRSASDVVRDFTRTRKRRSILIKTGRAQQPMHSIAAFRAADLWSIIASFTLAAPVGGLHALESVRPLGVHERLTLAGGWGGA